MTLLEKKSSQTIFENCRDISIIEDLSIKKTTIPFVLKPFKNIIDGAVLYPFIIQTESEAREILNSVPQNLYFAQKYINGKVITAVAICLQMENFLYTGRKIYYSNLMENPSFLQDLVKIQALKNNK